MGRFLEVDEVSEPAERIDEMLEEAATGGEGFDPAGLLHDLTQLPDKEARGALQRLAREKGPGAVTLLLRLGSAGIGAPAVASTEALGTIRDTAAASALQVLVSSTASGDVRKAARRALHRLASQGIVPSPAAPSGEEQRRAAWPLRTSLASPIDGDGNRATWLGFDRGGEIAMLGLVLNDEKGIIDLVSADMAPSRFDREASRLLHDEELPWIELPADYCRHLVEQAHSRNAASGTPLPLEYLSWRDRIGKPEKVYEQPLVYSVINAAEVRWDPRYLDRSGELFELQMFQMWVLPREELKEFVRERMVAQQTGLVLAGMSAEGRDRMVVDRAILKLFDLRRRALYKRRLEEMAYLLWKLEWIDRARMALAAALALEPPDRSLQDHPFVRRMVEWSLGVEAATEEEERARTIRPGVQLHLPY